MNKKHLLHPLPANPLPADVAEAIAERIFDVVGSAEDQSFEALQDTVLMALRQVGCLVEVRGLQARVTRAARIDVEGTAYAPLSQPSAVRCFGLWGTHRVEEPLYRAVGVHNGKTVKPLELRAGLVCGSVSPGLARRLGWMTALMTSRQAHVGLCEMGLGSASRATIETHVHGMGVDMAAQVVALEEAARVDEEVPATVASLTCGLDRKAIPMTEERAAGQPPSTPRKARRTPYRRTPPPPIDVNYRMAYVGSVTLVDAAGNALRTLRYGADAGSDPAELALRIQRDLERIVHLRGPLDITIVQDGASELDVLPETLAKSDTLRSCPRHELVDLNHALDYLRDVVRECEPDGDPHSMVEWYRDALLHDADGVDRVLRGLRYRRARARGPKSGQAKEALTDAIRYVGKRRKKMHYAPHWAANRVVGSGATESAAKVMGARTNLSGARWDVPGLRGMLTRRGLVTSERWSPAWARYTASRVVDIKQVAA